VAYYPFDGNTSDQSGNGHDGEIMGRVEFATGMVNSGAVFDGRQSAVMVADDPSFHLWEFTFAAWVKPTVIEGGNRIRGNCSRVGAIWP